MVSKVKKHNVIIRALAFVLLFFVLFSYIEAVSYNNTFQYTGWSYVYEGDIDVLIMGSSQAASSFDANYITQKTGKSTVILSSGAQSITQIYYNLLEVVKYQNPDVVIVESFSVIEDTLAWMEENQVQGLALINLDGMKMSPLKIRAAFGTLGFDGYSAFQIMRESGKTERLLYAIKNIAQKTKSIFRPKESSSLNPSRGTIIYTPESIANDRQYEDSLNVQVDKNFTLPKDNIKYMKKMIKLCIENDITIEFIKTPLIKNKSSHSGHAAMVKILDEMEFNISAYNLMDDKYKLNLIKDDYSDVNHLSKTGMQKVSEWLVWHLEEYYN